MDISFFTHNLFLERRHCERREAIQNGGSNGLPEPSGLLRRKEHSSQ